MKKFQIVLLIAALFLQLPGIGALAADYKGTTLRLEKTEGTVSLKNAGGRSITARSKSKLYNGYVLTTSNKSYAWISLDSKKAVKMDANTKVEVQKSDKALTLYVKSGKIFFDVKAKVGKDESYEVKTSTMTTGVRGTIGMVESVSGEESRIQLYEGSVIVCAQNQNTGEYKRSKVSAGETAICRLLSVSEGKKGSVTIKKEILKEEDVPGFAAVEIGNSEDLKNRIDKGSPLDVDKIIEKGNDKLRNEEGEAEEELKKIQEAKNKEVLENSVDNYFEEEESKEEETSGSSGGSGDTPSTPPEVPDANTFNVSNPSQMLAAVQQFNNGTADIQINVTGDIDLSSTEVLEINNISAGTASVKKMEAQVKSRKLTVKMETAGGLTGNIRINKGAELLVEGGSLKGDTCFIEALEGSKVILSQVSVQSGSVDNYGEMIINKGTVGGALYNEGSLEINEGVILEHTGTILQNTNGGRAVIQAVVENYTGSAAFVNENASRLEVAGGTYKGLKAGIIANKVQGTVIIRDGEFIRSNEEESPSPAPDLFTEDQCIISNEGILNISGGRFYAGQGTALTNKSPDLTITGGAFTGNKTGIYLTGQGISNPIKGASFTAESSAADAAAVILDVSASFENCVMSAPLKGVGIENVTSSDTAAFNQCEIGVSQSGGYGFTLLNIPDLNITGTTVTVADGYCFALGIYGIPALNDKIDPSSGSSIFDDMTNRFVFEDGTALGMSNYIRTGL